MIELTNINRVYGKGDSAAFALRGVGLRVADGAFVRIVGTSGSGKTTLLNVVGGLDSGYTGSAVVAGRDLKSMSDRDLSRFRNRTVGFVFQHFHLLDHLDARQNVAIASFFADEDGSDSEMRAVEALTRVGLDGKLHSRPGELSGGQKQRVAIARALFNKPRLILADEPTGNLDTKTSGQIIELLESLNRDDGLTVIVVTHEAPLFRHATQTVRLEDGRIVVGGEA
ncbi:MAG: ABC transporter ATP-binding protein [Candidatus Aminicenantes bacterium]|nr:ABC transporter ATP-binding protein [Candidatus Aminicenantes bacterium]